MIYYFLGIFGISQHQLAMMLKKDGNEVFGSDITDNAEIRTKLEAAGIKSYIGHFEENIKKIKPETVVINGAIGEDNAELIWAKKQEQKNRLKIKDRAEILGEIADKFGTVVAVSGCHGKTTASAMAYCILKEFNPAHHIGGEVLTKNDGLLTKNESKYIKHINLFVVESCEFKESFLRIKPDIAVVLNIDADHLDYYKNLNNIKLAFKNFAGNIKPGGFLLYNKDDNNSRILNLLSIPKFSFGLSYGSDFEARNIRQSKRGLYFDAYFKGKKIDRFKVMAYGRHNVYNALVAVAVSVLLNASKRKLGLRTFLGVKRRFEVIENSPLVIHDYAHHPAEIKAAIATAKQHFKKPVLVIFEPHTYTRTQSLWQDFKTAIEKADKAILLPIYSAREAPVEGVTSENLAVQTKNASYAKNYEEAREKIYCHLKQKDYVILILGAGNIVGLWKKGADNSEQ